MNRQRKPYGTFDDFRQLQFEKLAEERGMLFNFFYENNHALGFINNDDYEKLNNAYANFVIRCTGITIGSGVGVFVLNRTVFRNMPKFKIFRPLVFGFKYALIPLITYRIVRGYSNTDIQNTVGGIANKYNFGFHEYNIAMDIFERAYRVNKLEQLLEEGKDFDWSDVPEFKSKYVE